MYGNCCRWDGGDFAPSAVVKGVVGAVKEENIDVIITGKEQKSGRNYPNTVILKAR